LVEFLVKEKNEMAISEEKLKVITEHSYGTWRAQKGWKKPIYIKDAEGVYLFDDTGKRYLDFSSQLMCSNLGHKNKVVIDAIVKQAQTMPYIAPVFAQEPMERAVDALLTVMPAGVNKFFFSTSGAEANEGALIITRQYKAPNYKIISRYHSYHGATAAAMTLTGDPRRWFGERARYSIGGIRFAPDAYCYRCPFGMKWPDCHDQCAEYVDYMIKEEGMWPLSSSSRLSAPTAESSPPRDTCPNCARCAMLTMSYSSLMRS